MKKTCFIFLCFCFYTFGFAQTNDIVVYSDKGEEFTLYVNSVKQNDPPMANVRARNITGDSYTVRVQFTDPAIPEISQKYWTEARNVDITMIARQNNKGKWVLTPSGETPRAFETLIMEEPIYTYYYDTNPNNAINMNVYDGGENVNVNMTVTGSSMNIQAGAGSESVNLNMSISTGSSVTTSVTTTTVATGNPYPAGVPVQPIASGCAYPMSPRDFNDAINSIQSKTFEDAKITVAKQICNGSCMTSDQVRELLKQFTYEASRVEIAKYAYYYVFDPEKYYKVNDAFEYSSSIDELNSFLGFR